MKRTLLVPRPQARTRVIVDRALVASLVALYLAYLARDDLARALPGSQRVTLIILVLLSTVLLCARLALFGTVDRWLGAIMRAPVGLILVGILLVAAVPRLLQPPGLLPHDPTLAASEREALVEAHRMLQSGDLRPQTFARPSVFLYLLTATGTVTYFQGISADRWRELTALQPDDLAPLARDLNALLGLLTIALVYVVGRNLFTARSGLLAAALLALSPLSWLAAHSVTEDALAALLGLAAFHAVTLIAQSGAGRPNQSASAELDPAPPVSRMANVTRQSLIAGLLIGCAIGVRPSLVLLLLPCGLAIWWGTASRFAPSGSDGRFDALPCLLASLAVGYVLAVPYAFAALPALLDAGAAAARDYRLTLDRATIGWFVEAMPETTLRLLRVEPILTLTGGLGAVWSVIAHRRGGSLILTFLVPAGILLGLHQRVELRHFIVYTPFLALCGGHLLDAVWQVMSQSRRNPGRHRRRKRGAKAGSRPAAAPH